MPCHASVLQDPWRTQTTQIVCLDCKSVLSVPKMLQVVVWFFTSWQLDMAALKLIELPDIVKVPETPFDQHLWRFPTHFRQVISEVPCFSRACGLVHTNGCVMTMWSLGRCFLFICYKAVNTGEVKTWSSTENVFCRPDMPSGRMQNVFSGSVRSVTSIKIVFQHTCHNRGRWCLVW